MKFPCENARSQARKEKERVWLLLEMNGDWPVERHPLFFGKGSPEMPEISFERKTGGRLVSVGGGKAASPPSYRPITASTPPFSHLIWAGCAGKCVVFWWVPLLSLICLFCINNWRCPECDFPSNAPPPKRSPRPNPPAFVVEVYKEEAASPHFFVTFFQSVGNFRKSLGPSPHPYLIETDYAYVNNLHPIITTFHQSY